jgi:methionyl-tRNA formyltransferase
MTSAVVFAYHNVGVQCLSVLLAHKVDVALVVTHTDNPAEQIWFDSVMRLAARHGVPTITPEDPNTSDTIERIRALQPDFLFSFYYRNMLKAPLLALPARSALNMHGSLLPKYRGRVPVNWAVIKGETETGATLHYMTEKPDAGDIVGQQAVPILPDDTAADVFVKVTAAAVAVLDTHLPALIAGNAPRIPQNLAAGSYFGGRKPDDGRIDWRMSAAKVHNLVRGVAPPYPGAFTTINGATLRILGTRLDAAPATAARTPQFFAQDNECYVTCADGARLRITAMDLDGKPFNATDFRARFGNQPINLEITTQ